MFGVFVVGYTASIKLEKRFFELIGFSPILLLKCPKDGRIRKTIFKLALHRNNEVRSYLFNGLKVLWEKNQIIIWKCIDLTIKSSRKKAIDHKFILKYQYGVFAKAHKKVSSYFIQFYPKSIRNCSYNEIDINTLQPILYCLPFDAKITEIPSLSKLVYFLEELLIFTINTYIYFEKSDSHYNKWAHNDWNRLFFQIIANALLRLPKKATEAKLCEPIINNWEKSTCMMEEFLRELSLVGSKPELGDKLIELWLQIGDHVLSSYQGKFSGHYLSSEMKDIMAILIFADPTTKWNIQEWAPLKKMTPLIGRWCNIVGHHPDCFPSLVRLLKTIGFNYVPEFGIDWLYGCIFRVDNHKDFFERSRITSSLADLLYDSWSKQELSIKQNPERFKHFVFLVDKLAEQGESVAIRLQSKLQEPHIN